KRVPAQRAKIIRIEASVTHSTNATHRDSQAHTDSATHIPVVLSCLCSATHSDQPDMPFSPLSGARVASDAFDLAGGGKRQKTLGGSGSGGAIQATDAVEELHRRSAMAALTAGRFGAAGDEFGDDPLDEERWNQRDEERKAAE